MDPVRAAWLLHTGSPPRGPGESCARCGQDSAHTPVSRVLSKSFTAWDEWVTPGRGLLCPACEWGYRHPPLRQSPTVVATDPPRFTLLTPHELRDLLRDPVDQATAVAVPLRHGRKHVLPAARWGTVCVDGVCVPWTRADCDRLDVLEQLRGRGVRWQAFAAPAPPWPAVTAAGTPQEVLDAWAQLAPWRARRTWLDLAVYATAPGAAGPARG